MENELDGESFWGIFLLEVENNFGEILNLTYSVNFPHPFLDFCIVVIQVGKLVAEGYDVISQGFC